jgi:pre-mRNA-processing factor 39
MDSNESTVKTRGSLVSEWARLLWKGTGDADAARQIYKSNEQLYLDSGTFWVGWLEFELHQPTSESDEAARHQRIRAVFDNIRRYTRLPPELIKKVSATYFDYLRERGGKDAMKEFMQLDLEINGPVSIAAATMEESAEDGKDIPAKKIKALENGMDIDSVIAQ